MDVLHLELPTGKGSVYITSLYRNWLGAASTRNTEYEYGLYHMRKLLQRISEALIKSK